MINEEGIFCDGCKKRVPCADEVYENGVRLDLCRECIGMFNTRYFIEKHHERLTGIKCKLAIFCSEYPPAYQPQE
jgi:hypothetical protein